MSLDYDAAHLAYEEAQRNQAMRYAAYFIANGDDRASAISKAKQAVNEIHSLPPHEEWQMDGIAQEYGLPSEKALATPQIEAIAKEIEPEFVNFP